jgi:beta-phosphoglucomutase
MRTSEISTVDLSVVGSRISGVIFDLDGVILDSMPAHVSAWRDVFAEINVHIDNEFIYRHEGCLEFSRLENTTQWNRAPLTLDVFRELLARQKDVYMDRYAAGVRFFPQARHLVERLHEAGIELGLVTSSVRDVMKPDLKDWLSRYFTCVVTGDQVERTKPDPEPYEKALIGLQIPAGQAVVVENAPAGIQAAKEAGLTCLALTTTLSSEYLAAADLVFTGHEELETWLVSRLKI